MFSIALLGLHKYLMGNILRSDGEYVVAVFSRDGHFVGYKVSVTRIKHGYGGSKARSYLKVNRHTLVLGHTAHKVIIVAHALLAIYEE